MQVALFGCLMNFVTRGAIAVYETMGTVIATDSVLQWSSLDVGVLVSCSGIIGVIILVNFKHLSTLYDDYEMMLHGTILMFVACTALSIAGSGSTLAVQFCFSVILMYSVAYPVGNTAALAMFSKIIANGPQVVEIKLRMIIAIGQITLITKSECIQGQMLGWFASAGSASRVIFPILAGILSDLYGDSLIFTVVALMLLVSIFLIVLFKSRILEMLLS